MSEINHPVIRSIKTVKTDPFHNYDLHYVCEIGSTGLGNPIPFTAEKEFSICEHTQSSVNWSLCWIPAPDKKQIQKTIRTRSMTGVKLKVARN